MDGILDWGAIYQSDITICIVQYNNQYCSKQTQSLIADHILLSTGDSHWLNTEQSSLSDPFQDPRIFKIKQTFQPFYEWSFRNVNSIFAFSVTHFWIHTKTVLFEQLGLTILTEAVRCFQWYFQYHPHHHSLSTLQTPIHPLSLYLD